MVDPDFRVPVEADLARRGDTIRIFKIGQYLQRQRQGILIAPFNKRSQIRPDTNPEQIAKRLKLLSNRSSKLDVMIEILDRGVGSAKLAETLAVDDDTGASLQPGCIGIDICD